MTYIDVETGKRVNILAPYKGFSRLDTLEIRERAGVVGIEDDPKPVDFDASFYNTKEDWETTTGPYTVYERKPDQEITQIKIQRAKQVRQQEVEDIVVTTTSGKSFDGDEVSQARMSRAINALDPLETTMWILADNTVDLAVSREELREALRLAGAAQTAVWSKPYEI